MRIEKRTKKGEEDGLFDRENVKKIPAEKHFSIGLRITFFSDRYWILAPLLENSDGLWL